MAVDMVIDPKWGESKRETGHGVIHKLEGDGRNRQVFIRATHTDLREDVTGWVDTDNTQLASVLADGARGVEHEYEILVHRRRNVDPKPFAELGNREKVREVTKLAPLLGKEGDQALATSRLSTSQGDDVQAGVANPNLDSPTPAERVVPNSDTQRFEGWGFVANVGMVDLAYEELSEALAAGELDSISPELLKTVAGHLLNAADQAQRALVGRTDRGAQSHTRARGCVRTALRKYPVRAAIHDPGVDHIADLDAWAADIQKTATRLLVLAASL